MDRRRMDDIKGEDGGVWGRKVGKQLTQHTKMQQAITEVNPIKTTT